LDGKRESALAAAALARILMGSGAVAQGREQEELHMSSPAPRAATTSSPARALAGVASFVVLSLIGTSLALGASLDEIKKRGYMVVATEDDYPPFEAVVNGKPVGYDHALLAVLKKEAGFEIRQEILPWQGILPGVASGKYDSAVTAAVITDERAKSLDFTMPIAESTMAYVIRTGDDRIKSIKDLSGMTLGVQQGGASFQAIPALEAELKKTGGKLGQVVQYGNFSEAYQDLVNKRLDAVINNIVSLSTLTAEKPKQFTLGERVGDKSYAAWAVQKGNSSLLQFLNAFLAKEKSDGAFKNLQAEYLKITFDDLPNEPLLPGDRKM
jgi:polar amino acid transport system substrate-binding protein